MQDFFPIPVSNTAERRYGRLGLAICITLAPCFASKREAIGPAKTRVKSTTLVPDNMEQMMMKKKKKQQDKDDAVVVVVASASN